MLCPEIKPAGPDAIDIWRTYLIIVNDCLYYIIRNPNLFLYIRIVIIIPGIELDLKTEIHLFFTDENCTYNLFFSNLTPQLFKLLHPVDRIKQALKRMRLLDGVRRILLKSIRC